MKRHRCIVPLVLALVSAALPLRAEVFYPWREVYIDALDGNSWPGLAFVPSKDGAFAFCLKVDIDGRRAEREDFFYLVSEVGPHSPDGLYARLKIDLGLPFKQAESTPILIKPSAKADALTLEWSRRDEKTVIGRIRAPGDIKLSVVHYFPWETKGTYALLADGQVQGQSAGFNKTYYVMWTNRTGITSAKSGGAGLEGIFSTAKDRMLYFVAGVGDDVRALKNHIYRYKNSKTIDSILEEERNAYSQKRVKIEGLYQGTPEAITNNLFWAALYQPGHHRMYTPAGRNWIFPNPEEGRDHWQISAWGSFFNALGLSAESSKHALDAIRAILETQYDNGNIPGWRSRSWGTPDRSQPPVGSFAVLKLFQKIGDMEFLKYAYPYLQKWHAFWTRRKPDGLIRRDGNEDGLLEWGSDADLVAKNVPSWEANASGKQRAVWESGQSDLPNWDEAGFNGKAGTLTMNCLDLNSLYALDAWCLSQVADILGLDGDSASYLDEYNRVKKLINDRLWNEKEGFYFDRHWDGRFSTRKAASNFYPLLARIPDEKRALRVLKHLLDVKEFWGEFVLPSISRDDPAFKDRQYWRGTVSAPTNYLVYQGLKACGFDLIASEFAQKSAALFLRAWQNYQICPDKFDARTGEAGGNRHQSWGPLLALVGLEEYLDFTPWEGFRFGMIKPDGDGVLSRLMIQGRNYAVEVSPSSVVLREEGRKVLAADGGAVIRHFLYNEREASFEIKSLERRKINMWFLKDGKYQILVDDKEMKPFSGDSVKFEVPKGDHSVLILLLEEKT